MVWDPFEEIKRMHEEMDRVFGRAFGARLLGYSKGKELSKYEGLRVPVADVRETENSVIANIEIPGVEKKDIELNVTENSIEVKVEKRAENEVKEKGSYSYESRSHSFYRALPLPAGVKADEAKAEYKNGLLKVEIPKVKKIEIE
ncbi:Hsp20/alpha crystallin family protein [Candidatus Woesearchaeota archaeon]|nr:Hsp20/alpha crystallin family protein [Candidatus Woesearchaeota archaeon]